MFQGDAFCVNAFQTEMAFGRGITKLFVPERMEKVFFAPETIKVFEEKERVRVFLA